MIYFAKISLEDLHTVHVYTRDAGGAVCDGAVPRAPDAAAKTAESVKS